MRGKGADARLIQDYLGHRNTQHTAVAGLVEIRAMENSEAARGDWLELSRDPAAGAESLDHDAAGSGVAHY
jgi:hypothetical protein